MTVDSMLIHNAKILVSGISSSMISDPMSWATSDTYYAELALYDTPASGDDPAIDSLTQISFYRQPVGRYRFLSRSSTTKIVADSQGELWFTGANPFVVTSGTNPVLRGFIRAVDL